MFVYSVISRLEQNFHALFPLTNNFQFYFKSGILISAELPKRRSPKDKDKNKFTVTL